MGNNNVSSSMGTGGIGLGGATFLVLMVLKLLGKISISWFWVTAPVWMSFLASAVFLLVVFALAVVADR